MTEPGGFRVIIAGGGIAGLTLANALEKASIEYILLEARDTITPKAGASIGFFANGGRILDQLGCLEAIEKETCALGRGRNRDKNGVEFDTSDGLQLVEARYVFLLMKMVALFSLTDSIDLDILQRSLNVNMLYVQCTTA